MRTRNHDLTVGIFVILTIVALCFLAIRASGIGSEVSDKNAYTLSANFENAAGLTSKAKVTMSGVTIGQVTDIRFDPKKLNALVQLKINGNVQLIDDAATASILTSGLLGEKYIGITLGAGETMLKNGDHIEQTQSALVLEDLIGKFLFNKSTSAPAGAAASSSAEASAQTAAADASGF